MSAETHTPGPWALYRGPSDNSPDASWQILDQNGYGICNLPSDDCVTRDEDELEANARVLRATPELLAACQWAREAFVRAFGYESEQVKGMDKVIAKATGGQS